MQQYFLSKLQQKFPTKMQKNFPAQIQQNFPTKVQQNFQKKMQGTLRQKYSDIFQQKLLEDMQQNFLFGSTKMTRFIFIPLNTPAQIDVKSTRIHKLRSSTIFLRLERWWWWWQKWPNNMQRPWFFVQRWALRFFMASGKNLDQLFWSQNWFCKGGFLCPLTPNFGKKVPQKKRLIATKLNSRQKGKSKSTINCVNVIL